MSYGRRDGPIGVIDDRDVEHKIFQIAFFAPPVNIKYSDVTSATFQLLVILTYDINIRAEWFRKLSRICEGEISRSNTQPSYFI